MAKIIKNTTQEILVIFYRKNYNLYLSKYENDAIDHEFEFNIFVNFGKSS